MAKSTVAIQNGEASPFSYIFWKAILCLLLTVPAFGVTLLVSAILGQAGGQTDAAGIAAYGRMIASFLGFAVFLLLTTRMWLRLKLGKLPLFSFVLRETAAYGLLLCVCLLLCVITGGKLLQNGYISLFFLPHLPLAFLLQGWQGAFLSLLQLPLYALLALVMYKVNRRNFEKKIERGEAAMEGSFEEVVQTNAGEIAGEKEQNE